ncbi:acyl carrier protein [Streptomyces winkii]|uniref:acyl carrier protein n=1 Tax=Streptomyces winkii TaxID=3051178 RepID=UPI0028D84FF4|nr:acyl carrier protein [Streptomyces sp. DSM 40971]
MQQTEVLEVVTDFWKEVLQVDVGPDSDFFEAGGHSLALLALVNRLQEHFGVEMSVVDVFDYPTLGEFAGAVHERMSA